VSETRSTLAVALERVRCPRCGESMTEEAGAIRCANGHERRWRDGYLDFSDMPMDTASARTAESFGYEWTAFDQVNEEDADYWRWYFQDVPLNDYANAVALDAGCGKGRYTAFTADHVAHLVALDASDAVQVAARVLGAKANTLVIRSDLRGAPFADGAFDLVTCLGVLHHLTDPEAGFRALTRLVAPSGILFIYLYSRPQRLSVRTLGLRAATLLRRVTTHLPLDLLRAICRPIAALLYLVFVLPGRIGERLRIPGLRSLPLHIYRGQPFRSLWLDTFDRLSAPIEHRYVLSEVEPWFERAGFRIESARDDAGLFIVGRRGQVQPAGA
jgi:SAM-dependent methyltransferase